MKRDVRPAVLGMIGLWCLALALAVVPRDGIDFIRCGDALIPVAAVR